jgi:hypothetical protein
MDCYGLRAVDSSDFVNIDGYVVDRQIVESLNKLKESLSGAGFALRIESAYRPFERQLSIWNRKARGELKLLNAEGLPMERPKDEEQLMYAILTWSALPGASRHHLGTDLDVVDGNACPEGYEVELTPAECDGLFRPFHEKLSELIGAAESFGFDRVCALFGGQDTIRDYIAFPKNNQGRDVMIDSPSQIDQAQLDELQIALAPPQAD